MITITRVNMSRCKFTSDNPREIRWVRDYLKFYIDGAHFSPLFKEGKWDGYHRFYDKDDFFDFGLLDEVIYNLDKDELPYKLKDTYKFSRHKIIPTDLSKKLRPHQKEGIKAFFKNNIGILIVPTRGGKTFIASEIIRQTLMFNENENILFIVDTVDLFKQATEEISSFLGATIEEMGYINDKGFEPKQITIAMIQTLTSRLYGTVSTTKTVNKVKVKLDIGELKAKRKESNRKKRETQNYLKKVGFLAVDEVHEYSSSKRMNVLSWCKNKNQLLALSATPFKQVGGLIENLKIKGFFGGICYEVKKKRLQKEGYLAMDKIFLISYDHSSYIKRNRIYKAEGYQEYLTQTIHHNDERNHILIKMIQICKRNHWKTLVIFNSKKHGYIISEETGEMFISGDSKPEERDRAKNRFLSGKGKILLASNIYKKGITLPEAQIMILADGGLEGSNITQKQGRVLGAIEGKTKAAIIDVMDVGTNYFSEHSLNRLEVYSKEVPKDRLEVYMFDEIALLTESLKEWLNEEE